MIKSILVLLLLVQGAAFAQNDTTVILRAVAKLEQAILSKDSATLNVLLHKDVAYGHSSGWVQTKKDVVNDMMSGFLVYTKIEENAVWIEMNKEKAIVKERITVSGTRDGKAFDLPLFVMQVWLQNKKGWQLYARQSTKL